MSKLLFLSFLCASAFASAGEEKALERLTMTTDMLLSIGEDMLDDPVAGILITGDTVFIDINLAFTNDYQFILWTESAFNIVDFWLTNPSEETTVGDTGDHTTLSIIPDSSESGIWQLNIELLEGAYSDTAYYAAAVFHGSRQLH